MRELKRRASERGARQRETQGGTSRKKKVWFPAWAAGRRPDRFTLLLARGSRAGRGVSCSCGRPATDRGCWRTRSATLWLPAVSWRGKVLVAGCSGRRCIRRCSPAGDCSRSTRTPSPGRSTPSCFGLTVLVAGRVAARRLHSRFLWLWGCFSIALALPLAEVASHALSESAFILFATLALTQIDAHLGGGGRGALIRAAAFSALACLTRYMGAAVVLAVVPLLLAARVAPREKMKHIAVYTLVAAAPLGLWMLRNLLVGGSTTGARGRVFYSLDFIVDEVLRNARGDWWLVGLTAPALLALAMAAGPCAPSPPGTGKGMLPLLRMLPGGRCGCSEGFRLRT